MECTINPVGHHDRRDGFRLRLLEPRGLERTIHVAFGAPQEPSPSFRPSSPTRERRWIPWVGYPVVILTGLAMVDGDFHWLSDVVAGAFFGHAMAWSIGTQVRAANTRYNGTDASRPRTVFI